ncbi:MAG TPA: hypothetical protein PL009_10560 [Flavipsychrobacter sp.]|nr:hypothetical protein [Flavipsychrobacter sp.]
MKLRLLLAFLFLSFNTLRAQNYVFDYNSRCHAAYQQYLSLNLEAGNALIRQEIMSNPYNLMATYLADYDDWLMLLMNGDNRDYEQRAGHFDERLNLLSKGDENSPWFRVCKAGIYFHWALVHIRFGENLKAATTFRRSFLLLKENNKRFPDFPQNKIFLGLEEAVVGTIPENYQWLASIFGMKGSVKKGVALLNSFINNSDNNTPLRNEAIIYNCYLRFYLMSQQEEVWRFVNSSQFPVQNNLFHSFIRANFALNYRKSDAALQVLKNAQSIDDYKNFPIMDYEMGTALLHKLDANSVVYFNKFLSSYKGKFFVKDAHQKLAYAYYVQQNYPKANYHREQALKEGSRTTDADKQAYRFAENNVYPSVPILQARLLSDGGYYKPALQKLQNVDIKSLNITDKLECYFRLGRIHDELNNDTKAVEYYKTTINLGRNRKEHFAARSALQMGMMYERLGKITEAVKCYTDCLSMKEHDFQSNIDQQAKAGVNRLTQK